MRLNCTHVTPIFGHPIFKVFFWGYDTIVGTLVGGPEAWGDFSMKFEHFLLSVSWGHGFLQKLSLNMPALHQNATGLRILNLSSLLSWNLERIEF